MAARLFHCTVHNRGTGNIHWVDDHLDHGVWEDAPSESARKIAPGQTGQWQAESGGDIPIIGNVFTGTEGWVLLRTFGSDSIGSAEEMFIRVFWDVPYWHISPANATAGASRSDPRSDPGAGEFDTRDHRPPNISVTSSRNGGDAGASIQDLPWLAVEMWPGFSGKVQWDGKAFLDVYVDGNVPPDEPVRLPPFSTTNVTPKATPVPLVYSAPTLWPGEWAGENVEASITLGQDGLFDVVIRERDAAERQKTTRTDDVGITRAAYVKKVAENRGVIRGAGALGDFRLEVQTNVGTARETRQLITAQDNRFARAVDGSKDVIAALSTDTHRIGGDYLSLKHDATLEMCKLLYQGNTVGYALRYRRPSFIPSMWSLAMFDEILYRKTFIG